MQNGGKEDNVTSSDSKLNDLGSTKSKMEGIDKTAEKAMKGDMQKGGRGSKKGADIDPAGGKGMQETGEDKVWH